MTADRWTWDAQTHPLVTQAFAADDWCAALEQAPGDAVVGKVLCVCAALGIARAASPTLAGEDALNLQAAWIDDPTVERFDDICRLIFPAGESRDLDPHGIVWWALRTATSTPGFTEAGWALGTLCRVAQECGFTADHLRELARLEVLARRTADGLDSPRQ